jgi:transcriptional/translational regulatory protein YebC/TACO1
MEALMMADCDCEEITTEEDGYVVITAQPSDFESIKAALEAAKPEIEFEECGVDLIPSTYVDLDEDHEAKFKRLLSMLRELDDVQEIYHNANIVEEE